MDPSRKLPPVPALFPPFGSDSVGLRASIWQRGRPQLVRRSWNDALEEPSRVLASASALWRNPQGARVGGSGWHRLLAGVPQCFRRISVLHAAY